MHDLIGRVQRGVLKWYDQGLGFRVEGFGTLNPKP